MYAAYQLGKRSAASDRKPINSDLKNKISGSGVRSTANIMIKHQLSRLSVVSSLAYFTWPLVPLLLALCFCQEEGESGGTNDTCSLHEERKSFQEV